MSRSKPSSAENGSHSHGPVTAEGKRRASLNRVRHGICSTTHVLVPGEDPAEFEELVAAYVEHFQPNSVIESEFVQQIVAARWRLRRINLIETALMSHTMDQQAGDDTIQKMADSFASLAEGRALSLVLRYRTQMERTIQRCTNEFIKVRKHLPGPTESELMHDEILAKIEARLKAKDQEPEPADRPSPAPAPKLPNEPIFIPSLRIPHAISALKQENIPPLCRTA